MVDLELDTAEQAAALRVALDELWGRVQSTGLIGDQVSRIAEMMETRTTGSSRPASTSRRMPSFHVTDEWKPRSLSLPTSRMSGGTLASV